MTEAERELGCGLELPPGWDVWLDVDARQLGAAAPAAGAPPGGFDQLRVRRQMADGPVSAVVDRVLAGDAEARLPGGSPWRSSAGS